MRETMSKKDSIVVQVLPEYTKAGVCALVERIMSEDTCEADSSLCEYCPLTNGSESCSKENARKHIVKALGIETKEDLFREAEIAFPAFTTGEPVDGADFLDWFNDRRKA